MEINVEFGLLYEWQMPPGVSRADESRHFLQMMEQIRLAEDVGFTSVWSVEHHFLESFSHASAPDVENPYRPRCPAPALPVQPPDPGGRAGRDAGSAVAGAARVR
jgi:alkanesulfonate monooxygenase SsuD/methylene tetrahydromethanopterin reductase-like flavin-dependent oxidoreductase (luciferase family)